jgi:hypothetical protein
MAVRLKGVSMITKEHLNELHDLAMRCGVRVVIRFNKNETKIYCLHEGGTMSEDKYKELFRTIDLESFLERLRKEPQRAKPFTVGITDEQERKLFSLADIFYQIEDHTFSHGADVIFDIATTWWRDCGGFRVLDGELDEHTRFRLFDIEEFDLFIEDAETRAKEIAEWHVETLTVKRTKDLEETALLERCKAIAKKLAEKD